MFWIRCVVVMPSLFFMRTVFGNFRPTTSLDLKRCLPISFSFGGFTSTSLNNFSWHWSKNVDFELQWLLSVLKSIKNGFLVQRWSREWRSPHQSKKPTSINQQEEIWNILHSAPASHSITSTTTTQPANRPELISLCTVGQKLWMKHREIVSFYLCTKLCYVVLMRHLNLVQSNGP